MDFHFLNLEKIELGLLGVGYTETDQYKSPAETLRVFGRAFFMPQEN